jgi:hypothetical protein
MTLWQGRRRRLWELSARWICVSALCAVAALAWSAQAAADAMPPQTYPDTYSEQQYIYMDDGVGLAATISFPSDNGNAPAPGKFPVVLELTPYGRDGECGCDTASDFTTRGFVFAVVDTRGTGDSQGNLDGNYFSPREAEDGYELVQYLGSQPWSNGKVGMAGGSYLGIDQLKTAELDPSHLAAIAPNEALADIYNDAAYPGGIFSLSFDSQYLAVQPAAGTADPETDPSMIPGSLAAVVDQATGQSIAFAYLENAYDDSFYQLRSPITEVSKIKVPVFIEDGWRDAFEAGDIRMYQALENRPGVQTLLHVDPCTHKGCGAPFAPTDNPPDSDNTEAEEMVFFDHYLMGKQVPAFPNVRLYLQQADKYIDTTAWPPPESKFEKYYIGPSTISATAPKASSGTYFTNPSASPYVPVDQRTEDEQGITWRTGTLTKPLTLAGPIAVHLVASSTATNTDWFLKISDVAPDGSESIVSEGQLRASLRQLAPGSTAEEPLETLVDPQPLTPGKFYDFKIAIAPTGYVFEAGHRLQLRITSSNIPNSLPGTLQVDDSDPAASTFQPLSPANNTVRYGGADGTSILLPVYGGAPAQTVPTPRCPTASGSAGATRLGLIKIGDTRAQAMRAYTRNSTRGKRFEQFFCLAANGIRVGYASPKELATLPARERSEFRGRVTWISTSSQYYAIDSIRPGATLTDARGHVTLSQPFRVGLNTWYFAPFAAGTAIFKVRGQTVQEIGIVSKQLTRSRKQRRAFLTSFE